MCVACPQNRFLLSIDSYISSRVWKNAKRGREGELCKGSVLGTIVLEEKSSPTEARSVEEQVDVEHELQSDAFFCFDADIRSTESPTLYLLACAEVLLHLSLGEGRCFIEKLLSIFQRKEFDFFTFLEVLKTRKYFSQIKLRGSDSDLMSEDFEQDVIELEILGENNWAVLYKKDIMELQRMQVFL